MEDQELIQLQDLKAKLLEKAHDIIGKLKQQEEDNQSSVTLKLYHINFLIPNVTNDTNNLETKSFGRYERKLCEVVSEVTGITFENVDRKLLWDNLYQYTTHLVTKSLTFLVELTVKLEGEVEFEIYDITCHFVKVDSCYMLEIESWVQNITRMKNFSLLMSAISHYNEQNVLRTKILYTLEDKKYATTEKCTKKNGGILVRVHSPRNVQQVYLEFQWSLLFFEQTWQIEHFYIIKPMKTGVKFAKKNHDLLQNFCHPSIAKRKLLDLWHKLCCAIDTYENEKKSKTDCEAD